MRQLTPEQGVFPKWCHFETDVGRALGEAFSTILNFFRINMIFFLKTCLIRKPSCHFVGDLNKLLPLSVCFAT